MRFAQLMALTVNINKGKNDEPAKAQDFMPDFLNKGKDDVQPQSVDELKEAMMSLAERMNENGN